MLHGAAAYGFLLFHVERAVVAIAHRTVVTVRATQWEAHLEAFAQAMRVVSALTA